MRKSGRNTLDKEISDLSPGSNMFKVFLYLAFSKEPCKPSEISSGTGIPPGTVRPALRDLLKKGYVSQPRYGSYASKISYVELVSWLFQRLSKTQ